MAIENRSSEVDENIEVIIEVDGGCKTVYPSVVFTNQELSAVAADIYKMVFPRDLLYLQDDSIIMYEDNDYSCQFGTSIL